MQNPFMDTMAKGAQASSQTMSVANSMMQGVQRAMDSSSDLVIKMQNLLNTEEHRKVQEQLQTQKLIQDQFQFGVQQNFRDRQLTAQEGQWKASNKLSADNLNLNEKKFKLQKPLWEAQANLANTQATQAKKNMSRWDKYYSDADDTSVTAPATIGNNTDTPPIVQRVDTPVDAPTGDGTMSQPDAPSALDEQTTPGGVVANTSKAIDTKIASIYSDMKILGEHANINKAVPKDSPPPYPGAEMKYKALQKQVDSLDKKNQTLFTKSVDAMYDASKNRSSFIKDVMGKDNPNTGLSYTAQEASSLYNSINGAKSSIQAPNALPVDSKAQAVKSVALQGLSDTAFTQYLNQLNGKKASGVANAISKNITMSLANAKNKPAALMSTPRFIDALSRMATSTDSSVISHMETLYNNLGLTNGQRANINQLLVGKALADKAGVSITQDNATGNLQAHVPDKYKNSIVGSATLAKVEEFNTLLDANSIELYVDMGKQKSMVGYTMTAVGSYFGGKSNKQQLSNISRNVKEINYSFFEKYKTAPWSELQQWDIGSTKDSLYKGGFELLGNTPDEVVQRPWTAPGKKVINGQVTEEEIVMSDYVIPNIANKPLKEGTSFINLDKMTPKHVEIYERNMSNVTAALRAHRLDNGDTMGGKRVGDNTYGQTIVINNLRRFGNKLVDPKSGLPLGESVQMTVADAYAMLTGMSYTNKILGE